MEESTILVMQVSLSEKGCFFSFEEAILGQTLAISWLVAQPVGISTLVFLATLIVLLVVLARLDLIPRNLSSMTGRKNRYFLIAVAVVSIVLIGMAILVHH